MRDPIAEIDWARDVLHRAGVADRMRALSRREYYDQEEALADEPEPIPATWDDVELSVLGDPRFALNMRERLEANRGKWLSRVVEVWEARIDETERAWRTHCESPAHARWLANGGPARLWDRLQADKAAACSEFGAELAQRRMDEMVRLYLGEAAQ